MLHTRLSLLPPCNSRLHIKQPTVIMKLTATLAAAAGMVATAQAQYFSVVAARSASPIHLLPLEARGERIYIGGTSAHYCPPVAAPSCPNTTETNVRPA